MGMSREEFSNVVKAIRCAYTSNPLVSQAAFDLWYEMLKDKEYQVVARNLERHVKTNKFAPTIAELRGDLPVQRNGNFQGRIYDMEDLERKLLEVDYGGNGGQGLCWEIQESSGI